MVGFIHFDVIVAFSLLFKKQRKLCPIFVRYIYMSSCSPYVLHFVLYLCVIGFHEVIESDFLCRSHTQAWDMTILYCYYSIL